MRGCMPPNRALETFSQVVMPDGTVVGTGYTIEDAPRFPWRGFLLDTARHFMPVRTIKRLLDAMAHSKFNTLHWHIMDGQSFPLKLLSHPELAQHGAFSADKTYDHEDVLDIVSHARSHGIRCVMSSWCVWSEHGCNSPCGSNVVYPRGISLHVTSWSVFDFRCRCPCDRPLCVDVCCVVPHCVSVMPEIDGPAHATAWGHGVPDMIANCSYFALSSSKTVFKAQDKIAMNPLSNVTYDVLVRVPLMCDTRAFWCPLCAWLRDVWCALCGAA